MGKLRERRVNMKSVLIAITLLSSVLANESNIENLVSSLEKVATSLETSKEQLNLTGILGTVILNAQLLGTLSRWNVPGTDSVAQHVRLKGVVTKVNIATRNGLQELAIREREDYEVYPKLLNVNFWILSNRWKTTNKAQVKADEKGPDCPDDHSMKPCLTHLMTAWQKSDGECMETLKCRKLSVILNCPIHTMLQQFLYFLVAEMMCCSNVQGFQHPVTEAKASYREVLCFKMMEVNMEIDKNGFPPDQRNIFLENISLCGMMGYSDFYKPRWYTTIQSWQQQSGCFEVHGECSKHQTTFGGAALVSFLRFYATNNG